MGTTDRGLHFPEPTDRVNQGAAAIEELAQDVDAQLSTLQASGVLAGAAPGATARLIVQTKTATATTSLGGDLTITFPAAFPNGLCSVHVTVSSGTVIYGWFVTHGHALSSVNARLLTGDAAGAQVVASTSVAYCLTAVGW